MIRIAFIGAGHMATALAAGLRRRASGTLWQMLAVDPDAAQRERIAAAVPGIGTCADMAPALHGQDLVVWAVKPQVLRAAMQPFAGQAGDALHLSLAAGVRLADLSRWLGTTRLVRAMPNTPALVGEGVCGLLAAGGVNDADRARIESVLASTGKLFWVDSDDAMDAVTAISGSGPAYAYHFLEGLAASAVRLGFDPEQARDLALATVRGAVAQAGQDTTPLATLRERVTSRGGTTEAALAVLDARATQAAMADAASAAFERARELGRELAR